MSQLSRTGRSQYNQGQPIRADSPCQFRTAGYEMKLMMLQKEDMSSLVKVGHRIVRPILSFQGSKSPNFVPSSPELRRANTKKETNSILIVLPRAAS